MGSSYPHVAKKKQLTIEDVLGDEIRREMNLDTKTFVVLDDWDSVMHSVYQLPIGYGGETPQGGDPKKGGEEGDTPPSPPFCNEKKSGEKKKQVDKVNCPNGKVYKQSFSKQGRKGV